MTLITLEIQEEMSQKEEMQCYEMGKKSIAIKKIKVNGNKTPIRSCFSSNRLILV